MLKKLFFLILFSTRLFADNNETNNEISNTEAVIIITALGAVVIAGAVIAAPVILPASSIAAVKAAAATAAAKAATAGASIKATVAATSITTKVSLGVAAAQIARPYILPNTQEETIVLATEEILELLKTKNEFESCLQNNKASFKKNNLHIPTQCKELGQMFEMMLGTEEFEKTITAFSKDQD